MEETGGIPAAPGLGHVPTTECTSPATSDQVPVPGCQRAANVAHSIIDGRQEGKGHARARAGGAFETVVRKRSSSTCIVLHNSAGLRHRLMRQKSAAVQSRTYSCSLHHKILDMYSPERPHVTWNVRSSVCELIEPFALDMHGRVCRHLSTPSRHAQHKNAHQVARSRPGLLLDGPYELQSVMLDVCICNIARIAGHDGLGRGVIRRRHRSKFDEPRVGLALISEVAGTLRCSADKAQ